MPYVFHLLHMTVIAEEDVPCQSPHYPTGWKDEGALSTPSITRSNEPSFY